MTRTRWKHGGFATSTSLLLFASVNAVSLTQCSSQNTGSGGQSSNSIYMSNGKCHDNCAGYAFAITQWQNCWCSNEAPAGIASVGDCNQQCPGYPSEMCGNEQQGLFGYVALGPVPQGTLIAGGSSSSATSAGSSALASSFVAPSSSPPPPPSTQVIVSTQAPQTVIQTQVSTFVPLSSSTSASPLPPSSADPTTVIETQPTTETQVSSALPTTVMREASTMILQAPTSTVSSVATITPTPLVVTSAQAVTVGGSVVTHFITSTPSAMPSSAQSNEMPKQIKSGISSGAVAGATVGAIAGAALLAALIFFCLRRRKRSGHAGDAEGSSPKRNASVLSRVGLLRGNSRGPTLPRIQTSGLPMEAGPEAGPESAMTMGSSQMSENRRFSRPLFSDNRLNPNALMTQTNISRTSVSTLQDNQDYSRPLEVRNPDRPSTQHT